MNSDKNPVSKISPEIPTAHPSGGPREEGHAHQLAFWIERLRGELPALQWPHAHSVSSADPRVPIIQEFEFNAGLLSAIRAFCEQHGVSVYVVLLAAFAALLNRYAGQEDIILGEWFAGRAPMDYKKQAGDGLNPLALRLDLAANPTFGEFVKRVNQVAEDAHENSELRYENIVQELRTKSAPASDSLFQIMFSQPVRLPVVNVEQDVASKEDVKRGLRPNMDILLDERADALAVSVAYNPHIFESKLVAQMFAHWSNLLAGAVENADACIADLPLLSESEIAKLTKDWNATGVEYPRQRTLHEWFEAQVEKTPHARALSLEGHHLTYHELNARANQVASHLAKLGVGPDVLVGLFVERSAEMVIGVLGVLKAGGAYLPIDPVYPKDRLIFMLEDANAPVLLTHSKLARDLPGHKAKVVCFDTDKVTLDREPVANLRRADRPRSSGLCDLYQRIDREAERLPAYTLQCGAFDAGH